MCVALGVVYVEGHTVLHECVGVIFRLFCSKREAELCVGCETIIVKGVVMVPPKSLRCCCDLAGSGLHNHGDVPSLHGLVSACVVVLKHPVRMLELRFSLGTPGSPL